MINSDGSGLQDLTQKGFDLRDPNWIDNETLVYSSNQNGIFNLYSKKINGGTEHPLTNVIGGAFTPVVDSGTIYYTNYDKDGFSLYSLSLTDYDATQDSTIVLYDTTYTTCPEPQVAVQDSIVPDSTGQDSAVVLTACKIDTLVSKRDSVVKKPATPPLVLTGTLPQKIQKNLEYADIAFTGSEVNYKPIPTQFLMVPLFVIQERSPDFGVKGDGKATPRLGVAMALSDPLKKNTMKRFRYILNWL